MNRARRFGSLVPLVLTTALVVGACGSNPPSVPQASAAAVTPSSSGSAPSDSAAALASASPGAPTASPAAPPSPSDAADVITPFLATISEPRFRANSTVTGNLVVGATTSPLSGSYDLAGSDYGRALKVGAGTKVATQALRVSNTAAYTSRGDGPWFEAPFPAVGTDLGSVLRSVKAVEETGVETKNGRKLHHLVTTDVSLPPAVLGLTDRTIKDVTGALEFWVSDDGTPQVVAAAGTWTQASGKNPAAPATLNVEFALTNVGGSVSVATPDRVWRQVKSKKFHYSMAAPTDWEFHKGSPGKSTDWFFGPDYATVFGSSFAARGISLNLWTRAWTQGEPRLTGVKGFKLQSNKAATLAGSRARRLEFRETYKGRKEYSIVVLAAHGGKLYSLHYESSKPLTPADRALFDQFLSTFEFK